MRPDRGKGSKRLSRRDRDSNPRYLLQYAGFQDRCIQPLCHLSNLQVGLTYISFVLQLLKSFCSQDRIRTCIEFVFISLLMRIATLVVIFVLCLFRLLQLLTPSINTMNASTIPPPDYFKERFRVFQGYR